MMTELTDVAPSRRAFIATGAAVAGASLLTPSLAAAAVSAPQAGSLGRIRPALFVKAMSALNAHGASIPHRDRIAIADFAQASANPRFHLVDLANGRTTTFLVAHGSGSDPDHSGWVKRFSNDPGSNASCEGAFLASEYYVGKHGRSQRLIGLDSTNNNALSRAIVVHSAWYANDDMIRTRGMLGRSQGCFAVGEAYREQVFAMLGEGRMIYSAKV